MNPLVRLVANASPQSKRYILFAGAGVSKDAGQRSAWDIMMSTAALLRRADGEVDSTPIEQWFLNSPYANETYSTLVEKLFPDPRPQDDYLRQQLPLKKPGEAHQLIAELAARGVIRAVITTNFDDLIEMALTERGLAVQVLATENDFEMAAPLIHVTTEFRVYKPHGTLGRGRLRNTPADLATLPQPIFDGLVRAVDDHGLIVQGCAGEDVGILQMLTRRRKNLYPVFWLSSSPPNEHVSTACGSDLVHVASASASKALKEMLYLYDELSAIAPEHRPAARLSELEKAIEVNAPDAPAKIRDFIDELKAALFEIAPDLTNLSEPDETLMDALERSVPYIVDFGRIALTAAASGWSNCIIELYDTFGQLHQLTHGDLDGRLQAYSELNRDFGTFVVQEMFVMFIATILKHRRYDVLPSVLRRDLYDAKTGVFTQKELNGYVQTLDNFRKRRLQLNRVSVMGDLIHQRHQKGGPLHKVVSQEEMEDADYLLMLRSLFPFDTYEEASQQRAIWVPRAMLGTERLPEWLGRCASIAHAALIVPVFDIFPNSKDWPEHFKEKLVRYRTANQTIYSLGFVRSPGDFRPDFINSICSRP